MTLRITRNKNRVYAAVFGIHGYFLSASKSNFAHLLITNSLIKSSNKYCQVVRIQLCCQLCVSALCVLEYQHVLNVLYFKPRKKEKFQFFSGNYYISYLRFVAHWKCVDCAFSSYKYIEEQELQVEEGLPLNVERFCVLFSGISTYREKAASIKFPSSNPWRAVGRPKLSWQLLL